MVCAFRARAAGRQRRARSPARSRASRRFGHSSETLRTASADARWSAPHTWSQAPCQIPDLDASSLLTRQRVVADDLQHPEPPPPRSAVHAEQLRPSDSMIAGWHRDPAAGRRRPPPLTSPAATVSATSSPHGPRDEVLGIVQDERLPSSAPAQAVTGSTSARRSPGSRPLGLYHPPRASAGPAGRPAGHSFSGCSVHSPAGLVAYPRRRTRLRIPFGRLDQRVQAGALVLRRTGRTSASPRPSPSAATAARPIRRQAPNLHDRAGRPPGDHMRPPEARPNPPAARGATFSEAWTKATARAIRGPLNGTDHPGR